MCSCAVCVNCTNPGVKDGLCIPCDLGTHPKAAQKQVAVKVAVKRTVAVTKTCFDCGGQAIKMISKYRPYKGKEIWYCPTCRRSLGLVNH